jgi:hypothetical protein
MFCPKCGKQVDESDAFCRSCGHTLSTEKPATAGIGPASVGTGTVGVGKAIEPTKRSGEAAAIIRVVVLLFALGFVISERDWIRDAAYTLGGYDAALREEMSDAQKANTHLLLDVEKYTDQQASELLQTKSLADNRRGSSVGKANRHLEPSTAAEVYSWPSSADAWIDAKYIGLTPFTVPLDPGSHQLQIFKDGYLIWESKITVQSGHTQHVEVTLTKAPAGARESERRGAGGDRVAEPRAESSEAVQARGYKDEEGMYRVRRVDDGEAQYQFDAINEDLITLVPECATAEVAMKVEIDKSLRLDEYQLSNLMGREEARAFHKRVVEQGCF